MRRTNALLLCALALARSAHAGPVPIPAGKQWIGDILNIRAPDSPGWSLLQSTPGTWAFARNGSAPDETYAASVTAFPVPATASPEEFAALVKAGVARNTSPDRFVVHSSTFAATTARGYDCIGYDALADDNKARPRFIGYDKQLLQIHALYCHHPRVTTLGFAISFSHRGDAPDPEFAHAGEDFIAGIQVPVAAATPASTPAP
jgi:hypothetical protein